MKASEFIVRVEHPNDVQIEESDIEYALIQDVMRHKLGGGRVREIRARRHSSTKKTKKS